MEMELFRHNHAHFVGLDPTSNEGTFAKGNDKSASVEEIRVVPNSASAADDLPDFDEFKQHIRTFVSDKDPSYRSAGIKMVIKY